MDKVWVIILGIAAIGGMIGLDMLFSSWTNGKPQKSKDEKENANEENKDNMHDRSRK